MPVRILLRDEFAQPDPVGHRLRVHEVVLVGQREPDVGEAGQPADDVADQLVVHDWAQVREAPPVVGVEQDQVHLHAELAEAPDLLVEPCEELEIEPGVVEPLFSIRGKGNRSGSSVLYTKYFGNRHIRSLVNGEEVRRPAWPSASARPGGSRRTRSCPKADTGFRPHS